MNTIKTTTNQFPLLYQSNDGAVNIHTVMDVKIGNESDFEGQYRGAIVSCMIIHISRGPITTNAVLVPLDNPTFVGYAVWADNEHWAPGLYCTNWSTVPETATDDEKIEKFVKDPTEQYTVFSIHSKVVPKNVVYKESVDNIIKKLWALRDTSKPSATDVHIASLTASVDRDIEKMVQLIVKDKDILTSKEAMAIKTRSDAAAFQVMQQVLNGDITLNKAIEVVTSGLTPSSEYGTAMLALDASPDWLCCNVNLVNDVALLMLAQPTATAAIAAFDYVFVELMDHMKTSLEPEAVA